VPAITASDVKTLREKTQAGMMECKKALEESNGDMDAAVSLLRERGIIKMASRGDRQTKEGLFAAALSADKKSGAIAGVTCETDFVARNADFIALAEAAAKATLAAKAPNAEKAGAAKLANGKGVAEAITELSATIRENMSLANAACLSIDGSGVVEAYIHPPGKIGVLVALSGPAKPELAALATDLCMHVAAESPLYLRVEEVSPATLDAERVIYRNKALNEGKPANIVDKVVEGSVKKYLKESCLLEQEFVMDSSLTVAKLLEKKGKELGGKIEIAKFHRFAVGEGASEEKAEA